MALKLLKKLNGKYVVWPRNSVQGNRMAKGSRRWTRLRAFVAGAVVGVIIALVMPDEWSNLASTPWWIAWLIGPSFFVYGAVCIVFGIDFVSNDGAHPFVLAALWALSLALVMGSYGVGLSALARLVSRLGTQGDRSK